MSREEVKTRLAERREALRAFGVKRLAIFGSVARGEEGPSSDLDVLVEFESSPTFDAYMDLKFFLEDLFRCRVDLVTRGSLHPLLRPHVEKEAVYVA